MRIKKYAGYSLVEMLISLGLISGVLVLVGLVLTTMIKTSIMADVRTLARTESEFLATVMQRNIENSIPDNVLLFNKANPYEIEEGVFVSNESDFTHVLFDGTAATEVHMLPVTSDRWICIAVGYEVVDGEEQVYVMRTSASTALISPYDDVANHSSCFDPDDNADLYDYLTFFNSEQVSISTDELRYAFELRGVQSPYGNIYIQSIIGVSPLEWIGGTTGPLKPEYLRTSLFKTHSVKTVGRQTSEPLEAGCPVLTLYEDSDGDSYGNPSVSIASCATAGYVTDSTDCYDGNANAKPGSTYCSSSHRGDGSFDYNCSSTQTSCGTNFYATSVLTEYHYSDYLGRCHNYGNITRILPSASTSSCGSSGSVRGSYVARHCCGGCTPAAYNVGSSGVQSCR
jgi:type II secretory pathway pseudopilin PulG